METGYKTVEHLEMAAGIEVTVHLWQLILIGVVSKLTVFVNGMSWTFIRGF